MKYSPTSNAFLGTDHSGLTQLMWHVTDVCPLECPFCFATKTELSFARSEIEAVVDRLAGLGVLKVDIAGGEPLTFPHLDSVVRSLSEADVAMTFTTSGAGPARSRRWLVTNAGRFARIIISVDGPERLHDQLRGPKGTFGRALSLADELSGEISNAVRINTVATSALLADDQLEQLAIEIGRRGNVEWCLIQPHPANQKKRFAELAIEDAQFEDAVRRSAEALKAFEVPPVLIHRKRTDYTGYWVLYPDRSLRQHTNGTDDFIATTDFLSSPIDDIRGIVASRPQSVPLEPISPPSTETEHAEDHKQFP